MSAEHLSLDEEQLKALEEFAKAFFTISELEHVMEVPEGSLKTPFYRKEGEIYRRIHRGRLLAQAQVRQAILSSAINGSHPAQTKILEVLQEMKSNDHE